LRQRRRKPSIGADDFDIALAVVSAPMISTLPWRNLGCAATLLAAMLAIPVAGAAGRAVYTIADAPARVLRGVTWYRLEPGASVENGDIVDAGEHGEVQLELPQGEVLRITGPALAYVTALGSATGAHRAHEFTLLRGWFKLSDTPKGVPMVLTLPNAVVRVTDGIAVVHDDAARSEMFIERGGATATASAMRGRAAVHETPEGEYWARERTRVPTTDDRAPRAFVTAMPPQLRDPLPILVKRFDAPAPPLDAGRTINAEEAEPWLTGATKSALARRLSHVGRREP
jgi:hypothetical protein